MGCRLRVLPGTAEFGVALNRPKALELARTRRVQLRPILQFGKALPIPERKAVAPRECRTVPTLSHIDRPTLSLPMRAVPCQAPRPRRDVETSAQAGHAGESFRTWSTLLLRWPFRPRGPPSARS